MFIHAKPPLLSRAFFELTHEITLFYPLGPSWPCTKVKWVKPLLRSLPALRLFDCNLGFHFPTREFPSIHPFMYSFIGKKMYIHGVPPMP